jgi:hypothetical protein
MSSNQSPQKNIDKEESSTFIHINQSDTVSPHVIDLKEDEPDISDIETFREKMQQTKRKQVNFAEMVREANEESKHSEEDVRIRHSNPQPTQIDSSQLKRIESNQNNQTNQKNFSESFSVKNNKKNLFTKTKEKFFSKSYEFTQNISNYCQKTIDEAKKIVRSKQKQSQQLVETLQIKIDKYTSSIDLQRATIGAVGITALLLLPFPAIGYYKNLQQDGQKVISKSKAGFASLQSSTLAAFSSNLGQAKFKLSTALASFSQAEKILQQERSKLISIAEKIPILGSDIQAKQNMLTAGQHFALGNTYLLKGVSSAKKSDGSLTRRTSILQNHLTSALPQYKQALRSIVEIPTDEIPKKYQTQAEEFELLFTAMIDDMKNLTNLLETVNLVFGQKGYKKYLVVFQNSSELRATGGFAGAFAVVETQKGKISWKIPSGGTYDLQGQLNQTIRPPKPLQLVNDNWEFQDANWWSHLPASAAVMEDMYEESRGATIDGVITVNASMLERILQVTGPITLDKYDLTFNSNNVLDKIQQSEDIAQQKKKKPKSALALLAKKIRKKLKSGDKLAVMRLVLQSYQGLEQKEIQVYMDDNETQKTLRSYGWTGEILQAQPKQDYLHLVHSNSHGGKSNKFISEDVKLNTKINSSGEVINKVSIVRNYKKSSSTPVNNISHLRVYVPKDSKLISARGFNSPPEDEFHVPKSFYKPHPLTESLASEPEIDIDSGTRVNTQFGKTTFSNWIITDRGKTSRVVLKYKLPFKLGNGARNLSNFSKWKKLFTSEGENMIPYSMLLQKQSGTEYNFSHNISVTNKAKPVWTSSNIFSVKNNSASLKEKLKRDLQYGILFQAK